MFETAATGVLTDGNPVYGDGRVDQSALAAAETVYSSLLNESKVIDDIENMSPPRTCLDNANSWA